MALSQQIRKYFFPALKRMGFEKDGPFWRREPPGEWATLVEIRSGKLDEAEESLTFGIGFFSFQLDEILGWGQKEATEAAKHDRKPYGLLFCHFQTSLFRLDDDGCWDRERGPTALILQRGESLDREIAELALKFEKAFPKAMERYANLEAIIECKKNKIGDMARSARNGLYAAAACIELGRPDEAKVFLEESVRPGSTQVIKDAGERLSALL